MECLPSLAIEQISSELSAADLLTCSIVSSSWRSAFNTDYVWKKVCLKTNNKVTVDYVRTVHSSVSPIFEEPESAPLESLEPLCHWRIVYMKLMHVNRNWRRSNHATFQVTDVAYDFFDIQINNDTIATNVNDSYCEVWDIKSSPSKQETIVLALKDTCCKCILYLSEGMLVIVQDTLLQIYEKNKKKFLLKYRRLFDLPESCSTDIPLSKTIDDWYKGKVKITGLRANVIGRYFIGLVVLASSKVFTFHVWDIITGSKLKEELVNAFSKEGTVRDVKFCPPRIYKDKVLVCVQYFRDLELLGSIADPKNGYFTIIYLYDLTTLQLKTIHYTSPSVPWVFFEDHLFLTLDHTKNQLLVYNCPSGGAVASIHYNEGINVDSVQVSGDYLGLTTGGDLVILNVKQNFDVIFKTRIIKLSSHLFGFDYVFLSWDLVLITCWDKQNKVEVWSIKEKNLLSTLNTDGLIFPCNNATKFFVWNEMVSTIYMLKFW